MSETLSRYAPQARAVFRIAVALLFIQHGTQKLLGFPAAAQPMPLNGLFITGGLLEIFGGIAIAIGLFTRPVAFVLSGMMAVAYFMFHSPANFYPALNGGDAAVLFCFAFLYLVFAGPGAWSVDGRIGQERPATA